MNIYKVTFFRNINRPRLAIHQNFLELVVMIRANNLDDAIDIAKDIAKEHCFADHSIERQRPQDVRAYTNRFLKPELT